MTEGVETIQEQDVVENRAVKSARFELLSHVSTFLEPVMVVFGVVFLLLLLMAYASLPINILGEDHILDAIQVIWFMFVVDFVIRFLIAPVKSAYLKANWLIGLSLAAPFLRPLGALQIVQALHGLSLLTFLGALNLAMRSLRQITRGRIALYMIFVTFGVIAIGAVGVLYFDESHPDSPVQTLPEALWWSATLVTTLNHELDVVSLESRFIAFVLRLYGLNVFCFFMASVAAHFIGTDTSFTEERAEERSSDVERELREVRNELKELRALLAKSTPHIGTERHGTEE